MLGLGQGIACGPNIFGGSGVVEFSHQDLALDFPTLWQ